VTVCDVLFFYFGGKVGPRDECDWFLVVTVNSELVEINGREDEFLDVLEGVLLVDLGSHEECGYFAQ